MDSDPEVSIIGGGIIGASILYHLAARGIDAMLFEKNQLASGSTEKGIGGVRHVFSHPVSIEAGKRNLEFYRNFDDHVGKSIPIRETGYLYLLRSPEERDRWRDYQRRLDEHEATTCLLSPEDTASLLPEFSDQGLLGSLYAPECIHLDTRTATEGFVAAARDHGATVHTGTAVEDVTLDDGSVSTLVTENGTFQPNYIINAAGAWAPSVASMVDLPLPIERSIRRIVVTEELADGASPLVIDRESQYYFRIEGGGSVLICDVENDITDVPDPDIALDGLVDQAYIENALSKAGRVMPGIADAAIADSWSGIQTSTRDGHPILGGTPVDGFWLACGFNGLGVMSAPTVGRALTDVVVDGETDVLPLDRLGLDRFDSAADERIDPEELA